MKKFALLHRYIAALLLCWAWVCCQDVEQIPDNQIPDREEEQQPEAAND